MKVDKEIMAFGFLTAVMVILWLVFDNVLVINYRPILIEGKALPHNNLQKTAITRLTYQ